MIDDLDRIMEVMDAAFDPHWGEAWTRRQVGDSLTLPSTHYDLIDAAGSWPADDAPTAGFVLSRNAPGEEELLLIAVTPQLRGHGLGGILLDRLASSATDRGAEQLFLEMRENNPAQRLYRSVGFEPIGRRKGYYRLGDNSCLDAVTYAKSLVPAHT